MKRASAHKVAPGPDHLVGPIEYRLGKRYWLARRLPAIG